MSSTSPISPIPSDDDVNPPRRDPEDTNPNEDNPDENLSVNPPSPEIPSNDDEDADNVAGSRATRPVSPNKD